MEKIHGHECKFFVLNLQEVLYGTQERFINDSFFIDF